MRAGIVVLPEHNRQETERRWRAAESYGFAHAWTYDHLGFGPLAAHPWFDAVPTLAAAALVTSTIRLGTFVASPNFRHPVPFARTVAALDSLSQGRFTLGVGSGALPVGGYDSTVMGRQELPLRAKAARFAEFVELTDMLLTTERTTWLGEHYTAIDAYTAPGCVQQPRIPFVVAGIGPRAMALAARFGQGWVTTGQRVSTVDAWWRTVEELAEMFEKVLAEEGRDRSTVDRYLSVDVSPVF